MDTQSKLDTYKTLILAVVAALGTSGSVGQFVFDEDPNANTCGKYVLQANEACHAQISAQRQTCADSLSAQAIRDHEACWKVVEMTCGKGAGAD